MGALGAVLGPSGATLGPLLGHLGGHRSKKEGGFNLHQPVGARQIASWGPLGALLGALGAVLSARPAGFKLLSSLRLGCTGLGPSAAPLAALEAGARPTVAYDVLMCSGLLPAVVSVRRFRGLALPSGVLPFWLGASFSFLYFEFRGSPLRSSSCRGLLDVCVVICSRSQCPTRV